MAIKQARSLNLFCSIKFDSWVNGFMAEIQLLPQLPNLTIIFLIFSLENSSQHL